MSQSSQSPFSVEKTVKFLEELAGVQFIDAETKRPVLELAREVARETQTRKSDYELWLEQQDETVRLEHEMGAI